MDVLQFYPTPKSLVSKAWGKFRNRDFTRVLEPSAGEGALACPEDAVYWRYGKPPIVDCCEINFDHHAVLREKKLNVVGFDFLDFKSGSIYSHCLMNPPFLFGAKHVLKAWDILWDAEIVAILNADTLRNPCTSERQMLVNLIERHGEVEYIEGAFSVQEAERTTDVDVALVWLHKKADVSVDIIGPILGGLKVDSQSEEELTGNYQRASELAIPDSLIDNAVAAFNAAVRSMRDAVCAEARAGYYASLLGETMSVRNGHGKTDPNDTVAFVRNKVGERYAELKDRAWASILRSSNVTSRLSSAAAKRIEREFENIKQLEFTSLSIHGFLCGIVESQGSIQIEMLCDIFDLISKYHTENVHFFKGWKSNDKHKTCAMQIKSTRFILPGHSTYLSSGLSWDSIRLLQDFDKAFSLLDGKQAPEVGLADLFNNRFAELRSGERVRGSYFDVRYFAGVGTIHFFPTNKNLIRRLNVMVGRHRAWLPKEEDRVSEAFWLQFDNAARYDKEFRAEVDKRAYGSYYWEHPFSMLGCRDERGEQAAAKIDAAIDAVLERKGINVNCQLDDSTNHKLLLKAA